MKPLDFIVTARDLVQANRKGRTRETNIRRAVSTTYYALFHCLATSNANMLVGGPGARRSQPAWAITDFLPPGQFFNIPLASVDWVYLVIVLALKDSP